MNSWRWEGVTVGQGVPSQWRLLLDRPEFDRTRSFRASGSAAPAPPQSRPNLVREMQERLGRPVVIGYTSTEAALDHRLATRATAPS